MNGWKYGWTERGRDGLMDGWKKGRNKNGLVDGRLDK